MSLSDDYFKEGEKVTINPNCYADNYHWLFGRCKEMAEDKIGHGKRGTITSVSALHVLSRERAQFRIGVVFEDTGDHEIYFSETELLLVSAHPTYTDNKMKKFYRTLDNIL